MAQDISNKTLATLLVVAIVVSLGGTWLVLSDETMIAGTGLDVKSGTAQVTLTGLASITLTDNLIDFGSGAISVNYTFCGIDSNGGLSPGCNTQGGTFSAVNDQFVIVNSGNVDVTVDVKSSLNASTWIGGTTPHAYLISATNTTNGGCQGGTVTTWTELTTVDQEICNNLTYISGDAMMMDMNLTIPDDSAPGAKSITVTFTGTQA